MILDILENGDRYAHLHPLLPTAFAVLSRSDLARLPDGRLEIDGDAIYAMVIRGPGKAPDEALLETHDRHLDVHYVIAGEDQVGWKARTRLSTPAVRTGEDVAFYAEEPDVVTPLGPGDFAIHFPEDAHRPMVSPGDVHKVVVKIAL